MKGSLATLIASWLLCLAGYAAGVYLLAVLVERYPAMAPFAFVDTHGNGSFSIWSALLLPGSFMSILLFCFAIEALLLGSDNTSLKRLLAGTSPSARVDLFYVALKLTGGINLLAFVFSFGLLYWGVNQIHRYLHFALLARVHSYAIQFVVVYLVNTFVAYWSHRIMHTRWMWELHKVHHAAEEMNIVTPFRNHPIDHILNSVLNALPVALLGAAPHVVMVYYAVNLVYQSLVHSEINLPGKFWDYIWITPAAHRVHHSCRREHWDTNFGILTFWDRVFGTYHPPTNEKLTYGVEGGHSFNHPHHLAEVFENVRRWLGKEQSSEAPRPVDPALQSVQPSK